MPNELITPNLHAALIHYPLGILTAGIVIEFFSFLYRRSTFRLAGRWMILIGALSAIPATFSGIYALRSIAQVDMDSDTHWAEVKTTSVVFSRSGVWDILKHHMLYQSIATGVAALVVVVWLGASDKARKSLYLLLLVILLADMGLMIQAAHLGGQSVYKNGVAVEAVFPTTQPDQASTTAPVDWTQAPTRLELLFPPLEMHVTLAGVAIAIALVSIGLSFRKIHATHELPEYPIVVGDPASLRRASRAPSSVEMVRSFNPDLELETRPFAPAGRFWTLTTLLALATLLGGLWVVARGADRLVDMRDHPRQILTIIWKLVQPETDATRPKQTNYRSFAHAVGGSAIVMLPIFLALLARFAPRQKLLLCLFTLLLAVAVTVQIWVGVLLLYDSSDGKLLYLNPPATVDAAP
jgi:uncharacterized membrane protein